MRVKKFCLILLPFCLIAANGFSQSDMTNNFQLPSLYNDNSDNFYVIAHRGASAYYPENTMAAFEGAVAMGAEMIEIDVMSSRDGVPVVFHDAMLDDHTNGTGLLRHYTLKQLKKLDAGSWFGKEFEGQQIPTLEEVLAFASGKIALNIEIKSEVVTDEVEGGIVEKSLNLVKEYDMEDHVLFSSFDYRAISQLKALDPDVSAALLYNKRKSDGKLPHQLIGELRADAFNCSYRQLRKKWIDDLQKYNIPHFVYTVNSRRKMKALIKKGVTGIFTNKPDLLKEIARKFGVR